MTAQEGSGEQPGAPYEIRIDPDEPVDWASALKELERYEPPSGAPARPAAAQAPAPAVSPAGPARPALQQDKGNRVPELDGDPPADLATIMTAVNSAMQRLKKFEQAHPYLIAPNVFRSWEYELKETSILMNREFRRLRKETVEESEDD